ncbi:MAG: hypothetical protein ACREKH_05765, partial [Candidatus Rokuibacteriota bacterium]
MAQRWRSGRDSYRPVGETIDTSAYEVAAIPDDSTARAFVTAHHYSRSYPAARFRYGLYRGASLVGVAVFSVPARDAVLAILPGEPLERTELGRFVLVDDVPANGETWFLARAFELLRAAGIAGVVSFSDPMPRTRLDGSLVHPGHVGTIYQAMNAVFLGRARAETLRLLPDGTVLHRRAMSKLRHGEQGWRYVASRLVAIGASEPTGDLRTWSDAWLSRLTRPVSHPGNLKYAWTLRRRDRRHLPPSLPYLKMRD